MTPFDRHTGIAVPLPRANINTDLIAPARFLSRARDEGFADALFADLRSAASNDSTPFVLSTPPFDTASILVTGDNFGCGSSREHAVWALADHGIRVVIAPSFADIFYNNSIQNGLLPVRLSQRDVQHLIADIANSPGLAITVDLETQTIQCGPLELTFDIDTYRRDQLLRGLSEIDITLDALDQIKAFERHRFDQAPWLIPSQQQ